MENRLTKEQAEDIVLDSLLDSVKDLATMGRFSLLRSELSDSIKVRLRNLGYSIKQTEDGEYEISWR